MGQATLNVDPFTPAITRVPLKLSPIRRNSKKALTQEMLSENEMLLLHLPGVPFVDDGERLNRSCPLSLDSDSDSDDEPVGPFSSSAGYRRASFSNLKINSSNGHFLQPRMSDDNMKDGRNKEFLQAALTRMAGQGGTKLSFSQSFRIPRKKTTPTMNDLLLQMPIKKMVAASAKVNNNTTTTTSTASVSKATDTANESIDNGLKRRPLRRQHSASCA